MDLMDYMPVDYALSDEVVEIEEAIQGSLETAQAGTDDLQNQMFVDDATWGLSDWETELGIYPDNLMSDADRRARIKAKLRGKGTTTVAFLKNLAESFANGEVNITEHNDQYSFDVEFVSIIGIPSDLDSLKRAIEEAKPAHLAVNYIIRYNTWNDVADANYTWNMASAKTWDELKGDEL